MSFGGDGPDEALHTAIINSVNAGITYTAAAGNEAADAGSTVPASFPEVIAVSAIVDTDGKCGGVSSISTSAGKDDTFASFSNYGSVVDLAAPGVLVRTTASGGSYTSFSGTSAATPHVTGAAALYKSTHPGATPSDIRNALRGSGTTAGTVVTGRATATLPETVTILPSLYCTWQVLLQQIQRHLQLLVPVQLMEQ
jgi:subtilisin